MRRLDAETDLDRLNETDETALDLAVDNAEGLSPEGEEGLRRKRRAETHGTKAVIKQKLFWVLFWVACGGIAIGAVGFLALSATWLWHMKGDHEKLGSFLLNALSYVVVVMATLFAESLLKDKE